jgi:hypothetical protein
MIWININQPLNPVEQQPMPRKKKEVENRQFEIELKAKFDAYMKQLYEANTNK